MKISRRETLPSLSLGEFSQVIEMGDFSKIDLLAYFEDTRVRWVYLDTNCITEIEAWVNNSLDLSPVPEVGGFLLGRYCEVETAQYDLAIERFVQAEDVDFNSPVLLEFGSQVLMKIDAIRDLQPELQTIGWFHTHPGHTPFLSDQDLSSHEGFFQKPFQVAIVLDCLTDQFDTGIFSRQQTGRMNNKGDRTSWISWKAI